MGLIPRHVLRRIKLENVPVAWRVAKGQSFEVGRMSTQVLKAHQGVPGTGEWGEKGVAWPFHVITLCCGT